MPDSKQRLLIVEDETTLRETLAYNLKRVLNLVSFEQLMAAVGVKVPQSV